MPIFSYIAKSKTGENIQGQIDTHNRLEACKKLESSGLVPITIHEGNIPPPPPGYDNHSFHFAHNAKLIAYLAAIAVTITILGAILIKTTGISTYIRAKQALSKNRYEECLSIMAAGPRYLRQTKLGDRLIANALSSQISHFYNMGQYESCVKILDDLFPSSEEAVPEPVKLVRDASRIAIAEKCISQQNYNGAISNLALISNNSKYYDSAQIHLKNIERAKELEAQLPLPNIIRSKCVIIDDLEFINIQSGIVDLIDLRNKKLYLRNPMRDRVKLDLSVLIFNKDGVILLSHNENWAFKTLNYGQKHIADINGSLRFPRSLVFSRWAMLGWDIAPKYAMAVGSQSSYKELLNLLQNESQRLRKTPPEQLNISYSITDILPEAMRFEYDSRIPIFDSDIVESITFSSNIVSIYYYNKTDMRIKPLIKGYVFNADGVTIGTFSDIWQVMDLAPGQSYSETIRLQFNIPDELVFSRWASVAYNIEPAYFVLAGSSEQYDEMANRAEKRIWELNHKSQSILRPILKISGVDE